MTVSEALLFPGLNRNDGETLLSTLLAKDRAWLLSRPDRPLPEAVADLWPHAAARLVGGEPMAYILGKETFLGREFLVDPRVLIPRACTERLVTLAEGVLKEEIGDATLEIDLGVAGVHRRLSTFSPELVIEVGTGSGCIAASLALAFRNLRIIATDISQDALDLAELNFEALGVKRRIETRRGDLLSPVLDVQVPFLLVSNPPYVPDSYAFQRSVHAYEPMLALRGKGERGDGILLDLVRAALAHPLCTGFVLECRQDQVAGIDALLAQAKRA